MAFALTGSTAIQTKQGESASASYTASRTSKPYRKVSFSISGLPAGFTASFSPVSGTPTVTTTLRITAASASPVGSFPIRVQARDAKSTKTIEVTLSNYLNRPTNPAAPNNYFYNDSESTPIGNSDASLYQWSDVQSLVSRNQTQVKNGSWATRHQFVDPSGDNQVGKVIKFIAPWTSIPTPFPNSEAWFSAWYYFDSTGGVWTDPGNYNFWANHMQWKGDNHASYQDGPFVEADVKTVVSMRYINGVRRWLVEITSARWNASATVQSDTDFADGYFSHQLSGEPNKWANTSFTVPLDEWVFLECYCKMTSTGGHFKLWSGKASEGVLYLLNDMSDANFNFLKRWGFGGGSDWSTNQYLYWGIGNYQSFDHPSGTYNLYTDEARIADGQVGSSLPEF